MIAKKMYSSFLKETELTKERRFCNEKRGTFIRKSVIQVDDKPI